MDNNIMDELFMRIHTLEEEIKKHKSTISALELELAKKETVNDNLSDDELKEEIKSDNMIVDDVVDLIKDVKPVNITYIPQDEPRKLYVMGDFTGWEPVEMNKELGNIFTYNTLLLTGFKYFYCFFTEDQPIVDFSNLFEENPTNGQIHNVIYLANNDNKFEEYVASNQKKVLEASKRAYYRKQIGSEEDIKVIEQCIAQADQIKNKTERILIRKNEKINRIKKAYE